MKNSPQQTKMKKFQLNAVAVIAMACGAATSHAALTISDNGTTAPSSSVFLSATNNNSNTRIQNLGTNVTSSSVEAKGQSFITPDTGDANTQWGLTAVTLQLHNYEAAGNGIVSVTPTVTLKIMQYGADTNSTALDLGTELYSQTANFLKTLDNGDYFTFGLGQTVALNENSNYAFMLSLGTTGDSFTIKVGNGAQALYTDGRLLRDGTTPATVSAQDATFYMTGSVIPVPEPHAALLGSLGLLALLRRRR